jgi:hypothetical protein
MRHALREGKTGYFSQWSGGSCRADQIVHPGWTRALGAPRAKAIPPDALPSILGNVNRSRTRTCLGNPRIVPPPGADRATSRRCRVPWSCPPRPRARIDSWPAVKEAGESSRQEPEHNGRPERGVGNGLVQPGPPVPCVRACLAALRSSAIRLSRWRRVGSQIVNAEPAPYSHRTVRSPPRSLAPAVSQADHDFDASPFGMKFPSSRGDRAG